MLENHIISGGGRGAWANGICHCLRLVHWFTQYSRRPLFHHSLIADPPPLPAAAAAAASGVTKQDA